ncbi:hypothetical protein FRC19_001418 [Serendipita sp. 401]|nr:hypothetical protein FRC19_001418 [Serendipita sp. 401]
MSIHRELSRAQEEEEVVVVLGPAAAGKTTFINLATQRGDCGVGHDLDPGTTKLDWVRGPHLINGRAVIFIDTPGLDDAEKKDTEVMNMITDSLAKAKYKLDTVLYLHPISDNRIPWSGLERLKLLASLWKIDRVSNLVIVTTMWDEVKEEVGVRREEELKIKFWADLMAMGCQVKRFHRTTESALEILSPPTQKVVIVLGPAASGKTTFINLAAQRGDCGIGHDIEPGTTKVEWIRTTHPVDDHSIIFIDTPGLNDTQKQDAEMVKMIKDSLIVA